MTGFSPTNAFNLLRRLATAGLETPSLYLLITDAPVIREIQADIAAEVQVQLGIDARVLASADIRLDSLEQVFAHDPDRPVTLITLEQWQPKLAKALDRNVVLLTRSGAVLMLTEPEVAERLLTAAPNLRNRLTDVLQIRLDEAFGEPVD